MGVIDRLKNVPIVQFDHRAKHWLLCVVCMVAGNGPKIVGRLGPPA